MIEVAGKKKATRGRKKQRIVNHDDGRRGWSDLPKELVELFMRRLLYVDQIYLRATCKSWHSVGRVPISSQKKHMPWLLGIEYHSLWSSCKLYDPTYRKTYTIDMSSLKKKIKCHMHLHVNESKSLSLQVHESKSGWMLLSLNSPSGQHHFTMYSPFFTSNNLLELPVLATKRLVLATFSHSNMYEDSSSYHEGFSFVALSYGFGNTLEISTSKWGDNTWTSTRDIRCHFPLVDITWLYSQGRFYYATKSGQVGSLCVDGQEWSTLPRLDRLQYDNKDPHMMMSDEGELYLFTVSVGCSWIQWSPINLDAYRLNLGSQPHNTKTWERIESLGQDRALFLDRFCKLSPKLISNAPREVANRVYYCSANETLKTAFYSISGNSTRSYPCLKHYGSLSNESMYNKLWVEPPEY